MIVLFGIVFLWHWWVWLQGLAVKKNPEQLGRKHVVFALVGAFLSVNSVGMVLALAGCFSIGLLAGILLGILLSGVLEVSQFLFMRGLFEWDDMFHNTLGCVLGCAVSNALLAFRESRRAGDPSEGGAKE